MIKTCRLDRVMISNIMTTVSIVSIVSLTCSLLHNFNLLIDNVIAVARDYHPCTVYHFNPISENRARVLVWRATYREAVNGQTVASKILNATRVVSKSDNVDSTD